MGPRSYERTSTLYFGTLTERKTQAAFEIREHWLREPPEGYVVMQLDYGEVAARRKHGKIWSKVFIAPYSKRPETCACCGKGLNPFYEEGRLYVGFGEIGKDRFSGVKRPYERAKYGNCCFPCYNRERAINKRLSKVAETRRFINKCREELRNG